MTTTSRDRFAALVRSDPVDVTLGCLLIAAQAAADDAEAEAEAAEALAELGRLAAGLHPTGSAETDAALLARRLGEQAGFAGRPADYETLESSLLPAVLRRRRGLPITLSVVWADVGVRAGIACWPVALPGHVVAGVGDPDGVFVLVDPWAGGARLPLAQARARLAEAGLPDSVLRPADPTELLLRVLTNIRVLAGNRLDARAALWAVELSLLLPHHPVALRRELGTTKVRLGDYLGGAAELETYAAAVDAADEAAAQTARAQARMARARLN